MPLLLLLLVVLCDAMCGVVVAVCGFVCWYCSCCWSVVLLVCSSSFPSFLPLLLLDGHHSWWSIIQCPWDVDGLHSLFCCLLHSPLSMDLAFFEGDSHLCWCLLWLLFWGSRFCLKVDGWGGVVWNLTLTFFVIALLCLLSHWLFCIGSYSSSAFGSSFAFAAWGETVEITHC